MVFNFFDANPGSGMEKNSDPGSGINIPDPQLRLKQGFYLQVLSPERWSQMFTWKLNCCLDEENVFTKKLRKRKRPESWEGGRQAANSKKRKIYSDDLKDMCLMLCMICGKTLSHGSLKVGYNPCTVLFMNRKLVAEDPSPNFLEHSDIRIRP
jgi:hypothetical protein